MIKKNLSSYKDLFSEYTELRLQQNKSEVISIIDGSIVGNNQDVTSGASARVYKNGAWGFSSKANIDDHSLKTVINSATDNCFFLDGKLNKKSRDLPGRPGEMEVSFATKKPKSTQKEKIEFLKDIDNYIRKNYSKLSSTSLSMRNLDMEKMLITSDGSSAYTLIPRSMVVISLTMNDKDGAPVEIYEILGNRGQFEDVFQSLESYTSQLDKSYEHLQKKANAVYSNAGECECILDSKIAGMLAHEAIGHTVEADIVLGGSIAGNYLNKKVASPIVSMVDFANEFSGQTCPVPVYIDDEGVQARDAVLIDKGILKSFLHNKESANHFAVEPTGNARAYQFSDEPIIRMRNTAILPGDNKLEDMISSIENGYYLLKTLNGQADSTSEFMFGITLGYEIRNGKLGNAIKDTTISGVAFDMLKTISMISDEMSWSSFGMCGKKQSIPVGMGGPAIKCKVNIGGK